MARSAELWEASPNLPERDFISSQIYSDEEIFRDEQVLVKRKSWKFACHESEIPDSYDYRTLDHAGIPLIIVRGKEGSIRAFINSCSHRGAPVLSNARGNAKTWTCPFHHWSYNTSGNCISISGDRAYRNGPVSRSTMGLRRVRCVVRLGMVFINLWDDAPPFDDFVGDALREFEDVMGTVPLEVFHFHRGTVRANWKQLHEVSIEQYHEYMHYLNRRVAMTSQRYFERRWHFHTNGHVSIERAKQDYSRVEGLGTRDHAPLPGVGPGEFLLVGLFPDTIIICRSTVLRIDTINPIASNLSVLESRGLGIKGERDQERAMRIKHHNQYWGPFGRNFPEDVVITERVSEAIKSGANPYGIFARHEDLTIHDDETVRAFYDNWSRMMGRSATHPILSSEQT